MTTPTKGVKVIGRKFGHDIPQAIMLSELVDIPNGKLAEPTEMISAHQAVQSYILNTERVLPSIVDEMLHDYIVDHLQRVAADFNRQLRLFKKRMYNIESYEQQRFP